MVFSFMIVEITFSGRSFVFGQSHADDFCRFHQCTWPGSRMQHLILYTAPCLSSGLS